MSRPYQNIPPFKHTSHRLYNQDIISFYWYIILSNMPNQTEPNEKAKGRKIVQQRSISASPLTISNPTTAALIHTATTYLLAYFHRIFQSHFIFFSYYLILIAFDLHRTRLNKGRSTVNRFWTSCTRPITSPTEHLLSHRRIISISFYFNSISLLVVIPFSYKGGAERSPNNKEKIIILQSLLIISTSQPSYY